MTGHVVYEPTNRHHCVVMFRYTDNGAGTLAFDHPAYFAEEATVIECGCGRTFVAQEWRVGEMFPRWRREGRFARWRRERWRPPSEDAAA